MPQQPSAVNTLFEDVSNLLLPPNPASISNDQRQPKAKSQNPIATVPTKKNTTRGEGKQRSLPKKKKKREGRETAHVYETWTPPGKTATSNATTTDDRGGYVMSTLSGISFPPVPATLSFLLC
jgi:hypothetical protein